MLRPLQTLMPEPFRAHGWNGNTDPWARFHKEDIYMRKRTAETYFNLFIWSRCVLALGFFWLKITQYFTGRVGLLLLVWFCVVWSGKQNRRDCELKKQTNKQLLIIFSLRICWTGDEHVRWLVIYDLATKKKNSVKHCANGVVQSMGPKHDGPKSKVIEVLKVSLQQSLMTGVTLGFVDSGQWNAPLFLPASAGNVAA